MRDATNTRPARLSLFFGQGTSLTRRIGNPSIHGMLEYSEKTGVVRENPIHPDLAHRLQAWREEGWAELAGRTPTEADLVLLNQDGGQLKDVSVLEALHGDLERLGLRWEPGGNDDRSASAGDTLKKRASNSSMPSMKPPQRGQGRELLGSPSDVGRPTDCEPGRSTARADA
mgnify:CR=1 FL=1